MEGFAAASEQCWSKAFVPVAKHRPELTFHLFRPATPIITLCLPQGISDPRCIAAAGFTVGGPPLTL